MNQSALIGLVRAKPSEYGDCLACDAHMVLSPGDEPTAVCHSCAQEILPELADALEENEKFLENLMAEASKFVHRYMPPTATLGETTYVRADVYESQRHALALAIGAVKALRHQVKTYREAQRDLSGFEVHHKNGDPRDNSPDNLVLRRTR